jgi:transposase
MQAVYGDQCVDVRTVRRWVRRFKDGELGQADLSDKTRSGRPVTDFVNKWSVGGSVLKCVVML